MHWVQDRSESYVDQPPDTLFPKFPLDEYGNALAPRMGMWKNYTIPDPEVKIDLPTDYSDQPALKFDYQWTVPSLFSKWAGLPAKVTMEVLVRIDQLNTDPDDIAIYNLLLADLDVSQVLLNAVLHSSTFRQLENRHVARLSLAAYGLLKPTLGSVRFKSALAVFVQTNTAKTSYDARLTLTLSVYTGRLTSGTATTDESEVEGTDFVNVAAW